MRCQDHPTTSLEPPMAMKAHSRPRGLFALLISLLVFASLFLATASYAKNLYDLSDYSEGDPGDGVLNPGPEIMDPDPVLTPRSFGLFFTLGGLSIQHRDQVFLILPFPFYGPTSPAHYSSSMWGGNQRSLLLPERGWHNAP